MSATQQNPQYRNPEWLRAKYLEEGMTQAEIAAECGCSPRTIGRWLDRFDIEKPSTASYRMDTCGYEQWVCHCGDSAETVSVHRLLATLKVDDLRELDGKHVHHRSWVPWDNRLENIEVLDPSEHRERHTDGETPGLTV